MKKLAVFLTVFFCIVSCAFICFASETLKVKPGTKINVFVDGGINVFPFEKFKDKIKQESGIEIIMTPVAQADVYTKLKNEFISGTVAIDLVVYFHVWFFLQ